MSAYRQIIYHIIFRTKGSEKTIVQAHSVDLYKYTGGIIKNKQCTLFRINGMEDHLHILSDLHPSVALADYIRDIKVSSAKWMKASGFFPNFRGWGMGLSMFYSYGENRLLSVFTTPNCAFGLQGVIHVKVLRTLM